MENIVLKFSFTYFTNFNHFLMLLVVAQITNRSLLLSENVLIQDDNNNSESSFRSVITCVIYFVLDVMCSHVLHIISR